MILMLFAESKRGVSAEGCREAEMIRMIAKFRQKSEQSPVDENVL